MPVSTTITIKNRINSRAHFSQLQYVSTIFEMFGHIVKANLSYQIEELQTIVPSTLCQRNHLATALSSVS